MNSKILNPIILFTSLLVVNSAFAEVITLEDKKGNMIIVSPLKKQGDKVIVKRMSDGKEFTLSSDMLNEESQKVLKKSAKNLQEAYPKLEITAIIGKRSTNRSDYNSDVTTTAKVTVINKEYKLPCPPCKATVVFIGKDLQSKIFYEILSSQTFDITPSRTGAIFNTEPFINTYDDDGDYSHGSKYIGYLIAITDTSGNIVEKKTLSSFIQKAMEEDSTLAKKLITYKKGDDLNKSLLIRKEE